MKASYKSGHTDGEPVTCIGMDKQSEIMVVGGSRGTITVWELISPDQDKAKLGLALPVSQWRAHAGRIHSLDIIEHSRLLDAFVLVCCSDGVSVWTLGGSSVGKFGQVGCAPCSVVAVPPHA